MISILPSFETLSASASTDGLAGGILIEYIVHHRLVSAENDSSTIDDITNIIKLKQLPTFEPQSALIVTWELRLKPGSENHWTLVSMIFQVYFHKQAIIIAILCQTIQHTLQIYNALSFLLYTQDSGFSNFNKQYYTRQTRCFWP